MCLKFHTRFGQFTTAHREYPSHRIKAWKVLFPRQTGAGLQLQSPQFNVSWHPGWFHSDRRSTNLLAYEERCSIVDRGIQVYLDKDEAQYRGKYPVLEVRCVLRDLVAAGYIDNWAGDPLKQAAVFTKVWVPPKEWERVFSCVLNSSY